jgi:hypothetical protein
LATRFYIVPTNTADIAPAFGGFTDTTQAVRRFMTTSKLVATPEQRTGTLTGGAANNALIVQAISPPLAAQTLSNTITFNVNMYAKEGDTADNIDQSLYKVTVWSGDGTVLRGTLKSLSTIAVTELGTVLGTVVTATGAAASATVNALDGDRLVFEWALGESGVGTTPSWTAQWGGTGTDVVSVANDTTGSVPWFELSATVVFQAAVTATAVTTGERDYTYITASSPGSAYLALFRLRAGESFNTFITNWTIGNRGDYPQGLVRPQGTVDPVKGWAAQTSNGWAYWVDNEAPQDTPFTYVAYDLTNLISFTTSGTTVLSTKNAYWLRDPQNPALDLPLYNISPTSSDCLPVDGLYFSSMADEAYANLSDAQQIDASAYPVVAPRPRGARGSTLTVVARTFTSRDALLALLSSGNPLLFQAPVQYGIPDTYMQVLDVPVQRSLSDHRRQFRLVAMPFGPSLRPVGSGSGGPGQLWIDTTNPTFPYNTWADVDAANINTQQLLVLAF